MRPPLLCILEDMTVTRHLRITGRVQGVGFRYFMEGKASDLGVTGWVRNRHDGTVEAMVQGTPEAVDAMIAAARRGPRAAIVVDVRVSDASGDFSGFASRPTE
jgi:acylphosphatase